MERTYRGIHIGLSFNTFHMWHEREPINITQGEHAFILNSRSQGRGTYYYNVMLMRL